MAWISRFRLLFVLGTALALGCGSDDADKDEGQNSATTGDAGARSDGGPRLDPGSVGTPSLAAEVVGKACAADGECTGTGGKCLSRLTSGSAGRLLEDLVGTSIFLDNPGGYCSATCTNNAACGADGVCFGALAGFSSGECRKKCESDTDCRDGYECARPGSLGDAGVSTGMLVPSTCQPRIKPTPLPPGAVGKACSEEDASACSPGYCNGATCTGLCLKDDDCGGNARCSLVQLYGTLGFCEETCSADADCNAFTGESGGIGCTAQGTCGLKLFPLQPGVVGKACTDRSQCGGSADCATMLGAGQQARPAMGGYCSLLGCSTDAQCGGGSCIGIAGAGRCYKSCSADGDCRMGYTCQDRMTSEREPTKVCAPAP